MVIVRGVFELMCQILSGPVFIVHSIAPKATLCNVIYESFIGHPYLRTILSVSERQLLWGKNQKFFFHKNKCKFEGVKVKILLILVVVYLSGAFSWWTYSLINLSAMTRNNKTEVIKLTANMVQSELTEWIQDQEEGTPILLNGKPFSVDTLALKHIVFLRYGDAFRVLFAPLPDRDRLDVYITPSLSELNKINNEYRSRKRAYYAEAIFFFFIFIGGFLWLFRSIEKIVNLNRLQRNFMMSVTHELKTPVSSIKLISQTLQKRNLGQTQTENLLKKADVSADRLNALIESMLTAVKIENKTLTTHFTEIQALTFVRDIIEEIRVLEPFEGDITLQINENMSLYGDPASLKIMIKNLISNAIKYSEGAVNLAITGNNKELQFADQGIGVARSERKNIFKQFYRVGDENTRTTKGTGIGLYLVKNILKIHKAQVEIRENKPKGTIFIIRFS